MEETYVKLLEIGKNDAFYLGKFEMEDGTLDTLVSQLVGRVFKVSGREREDEEWSALEGWLVGDTLGNWDDGHYTFCEVKVEVVSNPTLIQST